MRISLCRLKNLGQSLGVTCWCIVTLGSASHDQFCWKHHGAYCDMPWDVVHGHHEDQPINWIQSPPTVIASTSSSSDAAITPDYFIRWT
jgi:hypothetical protein